MRNAFADELTKLAGINRKIILLSGDIGNNLFNNFKEKHIDRFVNCGVAEQNMVGVAAGLAMAGFYPITYTIAPFCTSRCLEQIRIDVAYHNLPVIIVGVGAGLSYAGLGPTHHSCEDIAFLRSIPNFKVVCPSDSYEVRAALNAALDESGPVYLRLGKKGEPLIHNGPVENFEIGKSITIRRGRDLCILYTGTVGDLSLKVCDKLDVSGYSTELINFHTVKPLDRKRLDEVFHNFKVVAIIEEHSTIGGFSSSISEWIQDNNHLRTDLVRFGTPDKFFKLSGNKEFARENFGLSIKKISDQILERLKVYKK